MLPFPFAETGIIHELPAVRLPGRHINLLEYGAGALFGSNGREGLEELFRAGRVFEHRPRPVGGDGTRADGEYDCGDGNSCVVDSERPHTESKVTNAVLTEVREVVMQLARDPVHGGLGCTVGDRQYVGLPRECDAAHPGGYGHEFGRLALLEERVGRLEEDEGAVGVDLGWRISPKPSSAEPSARLTMSTTSRVSVPRHA